MWSEETVYTRNEAGNHGEQIIRNKVDKLMDEYNKDKEKRMRRFPALAKADSSPTVLSSGGVSSLTGSLPALNVKTSQNTFNGYSLNSTYPKETLPQVPGIAKQKWSELQQSFRQKRASSYPSYFKGLQADVKRGIVDRMVPSNLLDDDHVFMNPNMNSVPSTFTQKNVIGIPHILSQCVTSVSSAIPEPMKNYNLEPVEQLTAGLPTSIQNNTWLVFYLSRRDIVDLSFDANVTTLSGKTINIPRFIRNHPLWGCILRFCGSWTAGRQKGLWTHLRNMMLEFQNIGNPKESENLPDVKLCLHGMHQNKRLETFLVAKFILASLLMSSLPMPTEQMLSKCLNSLPPEADVDKITVVTSDQLQMGQWVPKPNSLRLGIVGVPFKDFMKYLKELDWSTNILNTISQYMKQVSEVAESIQMELDVGAEKNQVSFLCFFSVLSPKRIKEFLDVLSDSGLSEHERTEALGNYTKSTATNSQLNRSLETKSLDEVTLKKVSHVKITFREGSLPSTSIFLQFL